LIESDLAIRSLYFVLGMFWKSRFREIMSGPCSIRTHCAPSGVAEQEHKKSPVWNNFQPGFDRQKAASRFITLLGLI
jgi:hypothetical protein